MYVEVVGVIEDNIWKNIQYVDWQDVPLSVRRHLQYLIRRVDI